MAVHFYETADDSLLKFAVILSRHQNKWVFCKHRARGTFECPGGHREPGEPILETAKRELYEETGAIVFTLSPLCAYSVSDEEKETFGMLYFAEIRELGPLPPFEIERIELFDGLPERWTYPQIQPLFFQKASELLGIHPAL